MGGRVPMEGDYMTKKDKEPSITCEHGHTREAGTHRKCFPDGAEVKEGDVAVVPDGANRLVLVSDNPDIQTIDQLLAWAHLDKADWEIEKTELETKTKLVRHTDKDLQSDGTPGGWTGYTRNHGVEEVSWLKMKAILVRKVPITTELPAQSIKITTTFQKPDKPARSAKSELWLITADHQIGYERLDDGTIIPYHDDRAMDIVVQLISHLQPTGTIIAGDYWDLAQFGKYTTTPNQAGFTQMVVNRGHYHLARLRKASKNSRIFYMKGNHENRLETSIKQNVAGLLGLRSASNLAAPPIYDPAYLMGFEDLGIEFDSKDYPNGEMWLSDWLRITHGTMHGGGQSGKTASALQKKEVHSTIQGHGHRAELSIQTKWGATGYYQTLMMMVGAMCRMDGAVPNVKDRLNHNQSVALVEFDPKSSAPPTVTIIPIQEGVAVFDDMEWRGQFDQPLFLKKYKSEKFAYEELK
jgi:hypothetical protein